MSTAKIIWTEIDEAPALATYSLLPIVQAFTKGTGVEVETRDISLAGRILSAFPERLKPEQKVEDYLSQLGDLVKKPEGNVIKLPNISASIPQLQSAIKELQSKGYDVPAYPEEAKNDEDRAIQERYSRVLGSAVNPVLREGNSDRRAAESVKKFGQKNPHRMMKPWPDSGSKCQVVHMDDKDFYGTEKSTTIDKGVDFKIEFNGKDGSKKVLKDGLTALDGEILSASFISKKALRDFYAKSIELSKKEGTILSLHLKATMMKVSDPILFGHAVEVYFKDVFEKYADDLKSVGANANYGLADVISKLDKLPAAKKDEILKAIEASYEKQGDLAMVDSSKGITNLHVPNDVIVDASMPNVVRDGGKMWNKNDELQDTIAMIPDRCYATSYKTIIEDAKKNGQFDPSTMGSVSNVGLMAQKAEEYGSHPTTFEMETDGKVIVSDASGKVLMEHDVEEGDVWRLYRAKDIPIQDWVKLAVNRAKDSGQPVVFWLDEKRAHDAEEIKKVNQYIKDHDTSGIEWHIMAPVEAMKFSLERIRKGESTIAATGNVLRDYLTDLFPILELGTSAKMLSIVPLLAGGGLFETGAGGSAPKHVQQFLKEGHLRWDSLGEFCALVPSLELISKNYNNAKAEILAKTLDEAIGKFLENQKNPSRKVNEIDNRGSHFYLAMYWSQILAAQTEDKELAEKFAKIAKELEANEDKINEELLAAQGRPADIGGYFRPDFDKASKEMRPSATLNAIIDSI